jgi:hypothetical protein
MPSVIESRIGRHLKNQCFERAGLNKCVDRWIGHVVVVSSDRSGLSSVDIGFSDGALLLDWILGSALVVWSGKKVIGRAGNVRSGQRTVGVACVKIRYLRGTGRVGYMHQNKPLADQT